MNCSILLLHSVLPDSALYYTGPYLSAQLEFRAIALLLDRVLRPVIWQCPGSTSIGSLPTSGPWPLIAPMSTWAT